MKHPIYLILATALMVLATGCSKKKDGGGPAVAPNSCTVSGGNARYEWVNGTCWDRQIQSPAQDSRACYAASRGQVYDPSCQPPYGSNRYVQYGQYSQHGYDACSRVYGYGWITRVDTYYGYPFCEYQGGMGWGWQGGVQFNW